jgi:hypothetical protein
MNFNKPTISKSQKNDNKLPNYHSKKKKKISHYKS